MDDTISPGSDYKRRCARSNARLVHTAPDKRSEIFEIMTGNVFTGEVGQPLEVGQEATTNPRQIEAPQALISTHNQLKKQPIKGFRKTSV